MDLPGSNFSLKTSSLNPKAFGAAPYKVLSFSYHLLLTVSRNTETSHVIKCPTQAFVFKALFWI
jgi:hypothetical protein